MTIVAGFPTTGFVILGADSEENSGINKNAVRKIATIDLGTTKVLIGGAGPGRFIDLAVQQARRVITTTSTPDEIREHLEKIVTNIYCERIDRFPLRQQDRLDFDLLCASWVESAPSPRVQMFVVSRGVSLILNAPETIGVGSYLADYLVATLYPDVVPTISARSLGRLMVYLLKQVKAYASDCSGETQLLVIYEDGRIEEARNDTIVKDELGASVVMNGSKWLFHLSDPAGWNYDEAMLNSAIDFVAGQIKRDMHDNFQSFWRMPDPPQPAQKATEALERLPVTPTQSADQTSDSTSKPNGAARPRKGRKRSGG